MSDRWQKGKELFIAALSLEPADRREFLEAQCAGDPDLLREVEELLESNDAAEDFMEGSAVEQFPDLTAPKPSLAEGAQLGQYEIIRPLGFGGMGEVYLAKDLRLNRRVAVKCLPPHSQLGARRFEQEAQLLSALNHPNILTVHDFGTTESDRFIVSEFVDGVTLRERIDSASIPLEEAIEIAAQIAAALASAHDAGIVHRDIKPENIMIRRDGLVKVLDFGIAKLASENVITQGGDINEIDRLIANPGILIGSVNYMSPEQAGGGEIGPASDIFSFGIVLFEMISRRTPFSGEAIGDVIESIRSADPVKLSDLRSEVPAEVESIVARCLAKVPASRFQSASELIDALGPIRSSLNLHTSAAAVFGRPAGIPTDTIHPTTSETERSARETLSLPAAEQGRSSRNFRFAVAAATVILFFVLAGVGYRLATSETSRPGDKPAAVSADAYQSYLRGRFFWNKRTAEDLKRAIAEFEKAIEQQPDYALAYVGLADCYTLLEQYTGAPANETLPKAKAYALRAVELDDTLAEAHTSLAYVYYGLWQWNESEASIRRALELNPQYSVAHHRHYLLLRERRQFNEAARAIESARQLEPLSLVINVSHARSFLARGDAETCITLTRRLIELYPDYAPNYVTLGSALLKQNKLADAMSQFEKAVSIERNGLALSYLAFAKGLAGNTAEAEALIAEMESRYARRKILAREIALAHLGIGHNEEAFRWLELDFKARSTELPSINAIPEYDRVRDDPRFQDLIHRIGL